MNHPHHTHHELSGTYGEEPTDPLGLIVPITHLEDGTFPSTTSETRDGAVQTHQLVKNENGTLDVHTHVEGSPLVHIDETGYTAHGHNSGPEYENNWIAPEVLVKTVIVDKSDAGVSEVPRHEEQSPSSLLPTDDSLAASEGSVGESNPLPRSLYERHPGNYPFPQAFRNGKDAKGNWKVERTIPPQPSNYTFDRRRFTMTEIKEAAAKHGYVLNRARFAQLLRLLIPRMLAS